MSVTESPGETSQKQYTVYFDPNGGVVSQTSKTVASGSIVGSMPTPTREGYMFLGWSTSKNTSGLLLSTSILMVGLSLQIISKSQQVKLTAHFQHLSKMATLLMDGIQLCMVVHK